MLKSVKNIFLKNETPNLTAKRFGNIPFKGNSDYERQPETDIYEPYTKSVVKIGGIITTVVLTAGLTLGIFCFAKGKTEGITKKFSQRMKDGWIKIFGKRHKKVNPNKSLEYAKLTNDGKDTKKISEELDLYEIFADIPGERISNTKIVQKTTDGKTIRELNTSNQITVEYIDNYDLSSSKKINRIYIGPDGKKVCSVHKFNSDGKRTECLIYNSDGITVSSVEKYNPNTGELIEECTN